jgi:tetratricopeptide (TPR) repeat protein
LDKTPDDSSLYNNRGVMLKNMGRFDDAVANYDQAIALKPDDADAFNNRGVALADLNRLAPALASYDQAIALSPDQAEPHNNRGNVCSRPTGAGCWDAKTRPGTRRPACRGSRRPATGTAFCNGPSMSCAGGRGVRDFSGRPKVPRGFG